jgi:hypothetical protein
MSAMHRRMPFQIVLLASLLCSACHTPAPDAGFIKNPELLKKDPSMPFDDIWIKAGTDLRLYKKVYVAPVDATHLLKMSWWDKFDLSQASAGTSSQAEAKYLTGWFRDKVVAAFKGDKAYGYQIVDSPDKETLIVELAIVEVVPTKVWLNSMSYAIAGAIDTGATAIEGRFRDGGNQEPIFSFKDKRAGPYSLVSIADLTWYMHAKDTLSDWADLFVEVCKKAPGEHVSSPLPFTLLPW